ncbi:CPBP family intramembrane glutamic endopeptidase [Flavobacterium subsaxonicum]|uniref:CAAX protease n=1 Tax=Flavobacterium subsaxonicum WB 4.1-42 = DSM 21790 TaxID=1121898 RepID=A0A0A2MQ15_9FLAO|nr:type II CAAX endopeptidase family protein [Flavobacterium subsaxonicum]KGO94747.1 CAAX protease [Flavobacterium subsaxonicum WB 4.1-42 = DSM 21790]
MQELRPIWRKFFCFNWVFALTLMLVVCIPRFLLVLDANMSANYSLIGLIMILSALLPFIFLTKDGRKAIGIIRPKKYAPLLLAFISGLAFSLILYYFGSSIYGNTIQNWYTYIGKSYNIPANLYTGDKLVLFSIMAFTGMIFSPIGEEFFFRGIVHGAFSASIGNKKASIADGLAFALTHIAHFGLVYNSYRWDFLPFATLLWVVAMFLVSLLFFIFKKQSGSIWGAVICHSGFNFGMTYSIFYLL